MAYGIGGSRFEENKRAVEEKYLGPLIKTAMNRCIHCTRCVRFMTEVAGVEELGAIGRGEDMEITTYLERGMMSELSANVNDLCPVGALTHRPWAFIYRPWELRKTESIDVMDAVGSQHPRRCARPRGAAHPAAQQRRRERGVDLRQDALRGGRAADAAARPALHPQGRHGWSRRAGTRRWRLVAGKLKAAKPERIGAIAGDLAGAEEMFALGDLFVRLGSRNFDCRQDGAKLDPRLGRASYLFNATIEGIERADAILLDRHQSAPRGARRSTPASASAGARAALAVGLIGERADLTYAYDYLGAGPQTLKERGRRQAQLCRQVLREAKHPMVIVGAAAAARADGAAVLAAAAKIALAAEQGKDGGWNALQRAARRRPRASPASISASCRARAASTSPGMLAAAGKGALDVVYLLGADEIDMTRARQGLRRLPGQPRRCRRPARRRHPAGRGLHREERHLRQHRGPRADDGTRRLPAGRRQGGLGDRARAVGAGRAASCPTTAFPPCAPPCTRRRRRWRGSTRSSLPAWTGVEALAARGGALGAEPFGARGARLLSHQSDRARFRRHGRAQRARRRACQQGTTGTHG